MLSLDCVFSLRSPNLDDPSSRGLCVDPILGRPLVAAGGTVTLDLWRWKVCGLAEPWCLQEWELDCAAHRQWVQRSWFITGSL